MFSWFRSESVPEPLPKYDLDYILGSGSYGVVWKATEKESNQEFALKVVMAGEENEDKQKREMSISSKLEHINLVKVLKVLKKRLSATQLHTLFPKGETKCLEFFKNESFTVFVIKMRLCGEDLRKWLIIEKTPNYLQSTEKMQFNIVKNILEGIKFLHNSNIIHRDLKPENIFFSLPGFNLPVKIGDYETCRYIPEDNPSVMTSNKGTELYRAPETWLNNYGRHSDLFSLGLIIWEIVQPIPQKELKSYFDRLVNDKDETLISASSVIENLRDLVINLCNRNLQQRIQTAEDIEIKWRKDDNLTMEVVAFDTSELQEILKSCEDKTTITLLEKVYGGPFNIYGNNITIQGQGKKTNLISLEDDRTLVLAIRGDHFLGSNFRITGYEEENFIAISIHGSNCSLENIKIINCPRGIEVAKSARNTTLMNITFRWSQLPLDILGDTLNGRSLCMKGCTVGVVVSDPAKNVSIDELKIRDAQISGISIFSFNSVARLSNVRIEAGEEEERVQISDKPFSAIRIKGSAKALVYFDNVTCEGYDSDEEWGLYVDKGSISTDLQIVNSSLGKIFRDE